MLGDGRRHGESPLPARSGLLRRRKRRERAQLPFLRAFENTQPFETNPIFAGAARDVLHAGGGVALVGAARARRVSRTRTGRRASAVVHRRDDLSVDVRRATGAAAAARGRGAPRERGALAGACTTSQQLARNNVPSAAAIYAEDMYVPRALSEQTAAAHRRDEGLAHQRVRAQRAARERPCVRAADGDAARRRLICGSGSAGCARRGSSATAGSTLPALRPARRSSSSSNTRSTSGCFATSAASALRCADEAHAALQGDPFARRRHPDRWYRRNADLERSMRARAR